MPVSFIGGGNRSTWKSHRHVESHRQTLSHIVVSSTPRYEWDSNIFSGDISSGSFEIEKSISFTHNSNGVILPSLHYKFLDKECWLGETNTKNLDLCDLIPC